MVVNYILTKNGMLEKKIDQISLNFKLKDSVDPKVSMDDIVKNVELYSDISKLPSIGNIDELISSSEDILVTPSKVGLTIKDLTGPSMQADLGEIIKIIIDRLTKNMQNSGFGNSEIELKISKVLSSENIKSLTGTVGRNFDVQKFLEEM